MTIKIVGIDLGKHYFHIHAVDQHGKLITRKNFKRQRLLTYLSNL